MGRKILFVTTDQQRYDALGCNGGALARTPVADEWARTGVNYRRAYNQNTVCMPARSTMLTGQDVRRHGVYANGGALPEDAPSIAAYTCTSAPGTERGRRQSPAGAVRMGQPDTRHRDAHALDLPRRLATDALRAEHHRPVNRPRTELGRLRYRAVCGIPYDGTEGELYNVEEDPHQWRNLWDESKFRTLRTDLVADLYDNLPEERRPRLLLDAPA